MFPGELFFPDFGKEEQSCGVLSTLRYYVHKHFGYLSGAALYGLYYILQSFHHLVLLPNPLSPAPFKMIANPMPSQTERCHRRRGRRRRVLSDATQNEEGGARSPIAPPPKNGGSDFTTDTWRGCIKCQQKWHCPSSTATATAAAYVFAF